MKKILLGVVVLVILISCESHTQIIARQNNKALVEVIVRASDWQYSNNHNNNYYFVNVRIPEITKAVYDNAVLVVYLESQSNTGVFSQTALPNVRHFESLDNGNVHYYSRTIDYDYAVGDINIYVTYSDFIKENPGDMRFWIKMIW